MEKNLDENRQAALKRSSQLKDTIDDYLQVKPKIKTGIKMKNEIDNNKKINYV